MKSFELTLFESTSANFKLAISAMLTKINQQTNEEKLLVKYYPQSGSAFCNPSTFVVLTYLAGTGNNADNKSVYISNPHMLKLKLGLERYKNAILSGTAFIDTPNGISVNSEYSTPVTIANIGRKNSYISFKLTDDGMEDGNGRAVPSVQVNVLDGPARGSILSIDEFLSVYEILTQINLPQFALELSLHEIASIQGGAQRAPYVPNNNYSRPASAAPQGARRQYNNYNNSGNYQNNYSQPQNNYQAQGYTQPTTSFVPQQPQAQYNQAAYTPKTQPAAPEYNFSQPAPAESSAPEQAPAQPAGKPKMTQAALNAIHVDESDLQLDDNAYNELFNL